MIHVDKNEEDNDTEKTYLLTSLRDVLHKTLTSTEPRILPQLQIQTLQFGETPYDSANGSPIATTPPLRERPDPYTEHVEYGRLIERIIDNNGELYAEIYSDGTLRIVDEDQPPWLCDLSCCLIPCWCELSRVMRWCIPAWLNSIYFKITVRNKIYLPLRRI